MKPELRDRLKELHEVLIIHRDNCPEKPLYLSNNKVKDVIEFMDTFLYD